jgi:tetratricopeptide (TPR) repeat protein
MLIKKKSAILVAAMVISASLLVTGCGQKKQEELSQYKQQGIEAMNAGNYEDAVKAFDEALKLQGTGIDEGTLDLCYYKAAAMYNAGQPAEAIDLYTAIIKYDESVADPYYLRGSVYLKEGEEEKMLADYELAIELAENPYEMAIMISTNLSASGYDAQGRTFLQETLDMKGKSGDDYVGRGRVYLALKEYDKAVTELQEAASKKGHNAKIYLAQAYEMQGQKDEADKILSEYLKDDNPSSEALEALGNMKLEGGDYESALKYYQSGLGCKTVANEQSLLRGEIAAYEYMGDYDTAKAKMTEYLAKYPGDAGAVRENTFLQTR